MKAIPGIVIFLLLIFASIGEGGAHGHGSVYAEGIGQTATYIDVDGDPRLTIMVTEIDNDFQGAVEEDQPEVGFRHLAVTFEIENISDSDFELILGRLLLIDSFGTAHQRSVVFTDEESSTQFLATPTSDPVLEPGESVSPVLIYTLPDAAEPAAIFWQPEASTHTYLNISGEATEGSSVVRGFGTDASLYDDSGNLVATIQVTDISEDWTGFDEFSAPEEGNVYWAVHFTVTNRGDRLLDLDAADFQLVNEHGYWGAGSRFVQTEASEDPLDTETLFPGESIEHFIVVEMAPGAEPVAVLWAEPGEPAAFIFISDEDGS